MAKTILTARYLVAGSSSVTLHTQPGRLLAFLASHNQTSAQLSQFYNATAATPGTQIYILSVNPAQCPCFIQFPRNAAPEFDTALHVDPGGNDLLIWSVDYG